MGLAVDPVDPRSVWLHHKTTRREIYDAARASRPDCDDVLLWNTRGELTESGIANVVVERGGHRLTPPVSSGLLAGVERAALLADGRAREEVVPVSERPPGPLERLLGPDGLSGEILASLRLELSLRPGHAWVLTRAVMQDESASAASDDSPSGPVVATPPTVGELLFAGPSERPASGLLIFVPEIVEPHLEEPAMQASPPPVESIAP